MNTTTPMATVPPITCTHYLEHARDSMDACLDELTEANKLANGLTSLLLLDMISETGTMAARIRAILQAASNDAIEVSVFQASAAGSVSAN